MAKRPLPDQATLLKLLRYEPDTGKLYWLARTPDMFDNGILSAESRCRQWNARFAGSEAFTADDGKGYLVGCIKGFGPLRAHRTIWMMQFGEWPELIDHINQVRTDNRLCNLQSVGRELNSRNSRLCRRNRSGRIGVHWIKTKRRWRAAIRNGGRYITLGTFISLEEACAARTSAEKLYGYSPLHGRKAKL